MTTVLCARDMAWFASSPILHYPEKYLTYINWGVSIKPQNWNEVLGEKNLIWLVACAYFGCESFQECAQNTVSTSGELNEAAVYCGKNKVPCEFVYSSEGVLQISCSDLQTASGVVCQTSGICVPPPAQSGVSMVEWVGLHPAKSIVVQTNAAVNPPVACCLSARIEF